MTDLERIGQRLVTGFPGTALTPELVQVVKEYKIGNIILFRENIASADQLRTLCACPANPHPQRNRPRRFYHD